MKTFKRISAFFLIAVMLISCCGCSQKNESVNIDIDALANELLVKAEFEDELSSVDDSIIKMLYNVDDFVNAQLYISSGATAEEIAVFEFDGAEAASEGLKKAEERIAEQRDDFESYVPKEIKKLDSAVVKQAGKYVIVCVSNGGAAEDIISGYLKSK